MIDHDIWETHAAWWQASFTQGADEEYETQMLPLLEKHLAGSAKVLDLGTGEGQVARMASRAGAEVIGVDRSIAQVHEATCRAGGPVYLRSDVATLPFEVASFDAVVACLVLEHVSDLDPVCAEISRVLKPGGRFLLMVNHPAFQTPGSGWIDDHILEEQYWRSGPYLKEMTTIENIDAEVSIPFVHRTLSAYVNAFVKVGLFVTELVEPSSPVVEEYVDASLIPRLLFARMERISIPS